jgi:hypothetical protein
VPGRRHRFSAGREVCVLFATVPHLVNITLGVTNSIERFTSFTFDVSINLINMAKPSLISRLDQNVIIPHPNNF